MAGAIRIGIGGWTFEPWRGTFYPKGLTQKRELEFASRALTSIEINGTYYSTFKPESWRKWRDETPDGFVFAVKASRYVTNRRELAGAGESLARFLGQGLTELGPKLGPINWQFMATKKFDRDDFGKFLGLLPERRDGVRLRHAIEVRSPTFATTAFYDLARDHNVAIVTATGDDVPEIEEPTADFTYARLMTTREDKERGLTPKEIDATAKRLQTWSKRGDVYAYFIAGAKVRNPAAATAVIEAVG
ncbi:MAG TPA: DUF72 domain-containing protein [Alphaproteobacteria bacterium]|jgi:uncharacterized protein YecE (DUF72 family)|nr:DUF72 domain-containing protein [Alphaproteobacteria bacterium]